MVTHTKIILNRNNRTVIQSTRIEEINIVMARMEEREEISGETHLSVVAPCWAFGLCIYGSFGAIAAAGLQRLNLFSAIDQNLIMVLDQNQKSTLRP